MLLLEAPFAIKASVVINFSAFLITSYFFLRWAAAFLESYQLPLRKKEQPEPSRWAIRSWISSPVCSATTTEKTAEQPKKVTTKHIKALLLIHSTSKNGRNPPEHATQHYSSDSYRMVTALPMTQKLRHHCGTRAEHSPPDQSIRHPHLQGYRGTRK